MDDCTETEVQRMLPLVSAQRREQALRYTHTFGRFCCLKSWLMVKDLIDDGMSGLMDEWEYNEHGKPSFTPSFLHSFTPYFSISHCKTGIAVAIHDRPVGIDIETIRHADEDLIARVMNTEEQRLMADNRAQADRTFTRLWTRKEAVVKAQGVGIHSFEQLRSVLDNARWTLDTVEKENYIYTIAYE